jgi:PHP family Zn ribbon phosphoesterase
LIIHDLFLSYQSAPHNAAELGALTINAARAASFAHHRQFHFLRKSDAHLYRLVRELTPGNGSIDDMG